MLDLMIKELSPDEAFKNIEAISAKYPMRLAGSEGLKWMAEYTRDVLIGYGIDARIHEFDAFLSFPGNSELKILSPVQKSIPSRSFAHINSTPEKGIEGELIFAGTGKEEDYTGKNAKGKITLCEATFLPRRQEKLRIAYDKGAIGMLLMNWGPSGNEAIAYGSMKQMWGNPVSENLDDKPKIPSISISRAAGEYLRDLCQKKKVRVWFKARCAEEWMKTQITVGKLAGTIEPEKFIIIGGHMDAWGGGVTCNATGNCAILEVARILSKYRSALGRSIIFAFWSGHETGTMAGSTWFVDNFWEDLTKNCLLYINVDSPGLKGAEIFSANSSLETISFHKAVEAEILSSEKTERKQLIHMGDQSFMGIGIPGITARTHYSPEQIKAWNGATHGWWHHSDDMTIEFADKGSLLKSMKVYTAYLYYLCNAPVVPFDFMQVAEAFEKRINEINTNFNNIIDFSRLMEKCLEFKDKALRLNEHINSIKSQIGSNRDWSKDDRVNALNKCILRLSRILTPVSSTIVGRYGQDPHGLTMLESFIPGFYWLAEMSKLSSGDERYKLLYTKIIREKNKVLDSLNEAIDCIKKTL